MSVRVVLILLGILLLGCSPERKAMKSFRYGKYESVIDYYKGAIRKDLNNAKAYYYIAESYRLSNRIKEAEPFYAKAGGKGISADSVKLYYAKSLQANAKYEEIRDNIYMLTDYKNQYGLEDILAFKAGYNISDSEVSTVGTSGNNSVMDNAGYYKNMKTII